MVALLTGEVLLRAGVAGRLARPGRTRGEEPDGHVPFVLELKGLPLHWEGHNCPPRGQQSSTFSILLQKMLCY